MSLIDSILRKMAGTGSPEFRPFSGVATLCLGDICGSPSIREGMDVELIARALNEVGSTQACAYETGGVIVQSVGDAFLAVWEPSRLEPSHAELALEAGKRIRARCRKVQRETGIEFHLRLTLGTGKLTGAWMGPRFQVVSGAYGVAHRLQALDIPRRSQLLCTSETLAYVPKKPEFGPIGRIRGVAGEEVPVFEFTDEGGRP